MKQRTPCTPAPFTQSGCAAATSHPSSCRRPQHGSGSPHEGGDLRGVWAMWAWTLPSCASDGLLKSIMTLRRPRLASCHAPQGALQWLVRRRVMFSLEPYAPRSTSHTAYFRRSSPSGLPQPSSGALFRDGRQGAVRRCRPRASRRTYEHPPLSSWHAAGRFGCWYNHSVNTYASCNMDGHNVHVSLATCNASTPVVVTALVCACRPAHLARHTLDLIQPPPYLLCARHFNRIPTAHPLRSRATPQPLEPAPRRRAARAPNHARTPGAHDWNNALTRT